MAYTGRTECPSGHSGVSPRRRSQPSYERPLWHCVDNLAHIRGGTYDTGAIVAEIEATFGMSSLSGISDGELERLFAKHRIDIAAAHDD
jgi:hypothetical protein